MKKKIHYPLPGNISGEKNQIVVIVLLFLLFICMGQAVLSENVWAASDSTTDRAEKLHLEIAAVDGHSTISMIKMFVEKPFLGKNVSAEYDSIRSPDRIAAKAISEEVDIIVVPTNLGAKLYNKGVPYTLAVIMTWGNLYLVSHQEINTWQDLKGQRIHVHAQGLSPDVIFRFLLKEHGLDPEKDLNITYLTGPHALAMSFLGGKSKISMMPEPMLSRVMEKNANTKIVFDLQKEWQKVTGSQYPGFPQGAIMIKNSILKNYPDIVGHFLDKYKESINWVNSNPQKAGVYAEGLGTGMSASAVQEAIPGCGLRYVTTLAAKNDLEAFFKILFKYAPETIGGRMPDASFYLQN